jgi:signal transduction protein with GAF and PtsI domain
MEPNNQPVDKTAFLDEEAQSFIASISASLSCQNDINATLAQVNVQITEFLAAEALSIFVVDEFTGDLVLTHATGQVGHEIIGLRLKSNQGVVGWVVKHSEDLIVPYPGLDARFFEGVDEDTGFSTRSILCSPIRDKGRTIGAIEVLNKKEGTFNDDDLELLRAIAQLMAEVISTAA